MLLSNRAGIECLRKTGRPMLYAWWTFGLIFLGGLVFGPAVQWYAFGDAWTGFPFGIDLTDNKTLIAAIFWVLALILGRNERKAKIFVLTASIVTIIIFSIPHSLLGSELDYKTNKVIQANCIKLNKVARSIHFNETYALLGKRSGEHENFRKNGSGSFGFQFKLGKI